MILFYAFLVLGLISLIVFLKMRVKESTVKAAMVKSFTSVFFIATAVAATAVSGGADIVYSFLIIMGLLFGLLGDIWLDLKWVYPKDNDTYTFAGFLAFAVGHILFLTGLISKFATTDTWLYVVIPIVASIVISLGNVMLEKPMKMKYGKFKLITFIYGAILFSMTLVSLGLSIATGFSEMTVVFMFIGGVLFLLSDLILSGTYFGEGKDRPIDIILNHVLYYVAQFVIAASLIFLG